ncbi:MAG: hypothetical protein SGARI_004871 [Bacillariaceae sp.]
MFKYSPKVDEETIEDSGTEEEDTEEEDATEDNEDEAIAEETPILPWKETVVVVVRNPINEHLKEWAKVVQPNAPNGLMEIRSKNQHVLSQLGHSNANKVHVVRAEHIWKDLVSLEEILGNPNQPNPSDWPALTDPSIELMSNMARLPEVSPQGSLGEIYTACGVASATDLEEKC